jgi:peptidoglycan/LPS O-acetylase OafA/YrhL
VIPGTEGDPLSGNDKQTNKPFWLKRKKRKNPMAVVVVVIVAIVVVAVLAARAGAGHRDDPFRNFIGLVRVFRDFVFVFFG